MGFHKRYINDNQIIDMYRTQGCQSVIDWFTKGVDAVITSGKLSDQVYTLIYEGSWNEVSEIISKASMKRQFN